jgi:hypothetical protein
MQTVRECMKTKRGVGGQMIMASGQHAGMAMSDHKN